MNKSICIILFILIYLSINAQEKPPEFIWETRTEINELNDIRSSKIDNNFLFLVEDTIMVVYSYSDYENRIFNQGIIKYNFSGKLISNYEIRDTMEFFITDIIVNDDSYSLFLQNRYFNLATIHIKEYTKNFELIEDKTPEEPYVIISGFPIPGYGYRKFNNSFYFMEDTVTYDKNNLPNMFINQLVILDSEYKSKSVKFDTSQIEYKYDTQYFPWVVDTLPNNKYLFSVIGPDFLSEEIYTVIFIADENLNVIKQKKFDNPEYRYFRLEYLYSNQNMIFFRGKIDKNDGEGIRQYIYVTDHELNLIYNELYTSNLRLTYESKTLEDRNEIIDYGIYYSNFNNFYGFSIYDFNGKIKGANYWKNKSDSYDKINHLIYLGNDEILIVGNETDEIYLAKIKLPDYTSVETNYTQETNFLISPNPASDYIEISMSNKGLQPFANSEEIEIYNVLGERVYSTKDNALRQAQQPRSRSAEVGKGGSSSGYFDYAQQPIRIDISHLPRGVYFIRIGERVEKFVKK